MKRLLQFMCESSHEHSVTPQELSHLERYLDALYGAIGIDIDLTKRHFLERVNDARNGKQITITELSELFHHVFQRHNLAIKAAPKGWEAVMVSRSTDVNVPFVLNWDDKQGEMHLVPKTVMRKHGFQTRTRKLVVEDV